MNNLITIEDLKGKAILIESSNSYEQLKSLKYTNKDMFIDGE
jgi:hypothetical protein